ncbi:MAG: CTP synthase [Thaumarchaeota archaeon]|nr:CTP synthase [Nitrososphaerota archaeon]
MPKYIFVTGGVMSGLGKGITASSLAKILQLSGLVVTCMKVDPYINFDAGTMNPIAHGEVFVTDDGGETDMDLGNYERFLNENLSKENNITTGQVYNAVIEDERKGKYLGKCVQIIPHVTDEIKRRIRNRVAKSAADVVVIECGGTVGDIESLPFLEAFRQMRLEDGFDNTLFVHVTLAPEMGAVGEMKTKPTQHSVQELRRIGIQPDLIVVRGIRPLPTEAKEKLALFTSVPPQNVISNPDVDSIYQVPEALYREGVMKPMMGHLRIKGRKTDLSEWNAVASRFSRQKEFVTIAMVGKYVTLMDSYVSVNLALQHAAAANGVGVEIRWIESEELERGSREDVDSSARLRAVLGGVDGIVLPQGYGKRGTEGKIMTAEYARNAQKPLLGLCFGFQLSIVSYARHVLGLKEANSTELAAQTPDPVVDLLPEQKGVSNMGGTMRLGGHDISVQRPSRAYDVYGSKTVRGRHRHRFELNQSYMERLEDAGMHFSAFSDGGRRAEILELRDHPFFMGTQYHPEYCSRPEYPEPMFMAFVKAAIEERETKVKQFEVAAASSN